MARILVNGLKSKVGGGKAILDGYLRSLRESEPADEYFVLTPDAEAYRWCEAANIRLVDVPALFKRNIMTVGLYHLAMPRLLRRHRIEAILNFGDIVIPAAIPQLYNFDWAFAVYPEGSFWSRLKPSERLLYNVKLFFFRAYLKHATIVMAQTQAMVDRLRSSYRLPRVELVPPAVDAPREEAVARRFALPSGRMTFVYPANYYPHKNHDVLLDVARRIRSRRQPLTMVVTLDPDEHPGAAAFLGRVEQESLTAEIANVGRVPGAHMPSLYRECDALLMPSLLETFGFPYVEAMQHGLAILTSDRDFARSVCGDAAIYFDPADPESIAAEMERVFADELLRRDKTAIGAARSAAMWSSRQVFDRYQELLGCLVRPSNGGG